MKNIFNLKNTIIFVSLSVLWKIFISATLCLHADEAYYWLWSKYLSLSYYDHAPMVAYFIKLTTLFSNQEFFVRLSSILVTIILSFVLWKLVIKLFKNEQIASASIMILHSMPIMFTASVIITPDTPVFLFLSVATYYVWKLIDTENQNNWYLIGLFFGLSMLSKYTAILFLLSLFLYVILLNKYNWFKKYQLYLGLIISFVCFLPVLVWNWNYHWVSFTYQFGHGLSNEGIRFNYIGEYFATQMGIFNIFLFIPALIISLKYLFSKQKEKVFLAVFSVPVILFYAVTALKKLPGANWPIPAYFTFSIIAALFCLEKSNKLKKNILVISICFNVLVSILIGLHAKYTIVPLDKFSNELAVADATNYFHGYKELTEKLLQEGIDFVITPSHQLSSIIAYYGKDKIKTHAYSNSHKKSQFDIWKLWKDSAAPFNIEQAAFVYESKEGNVPYDIHILFEEASPDIIEKATIRNNNIARRYFIRKASKLKKYYI